MTLLEESTKSLLSVKVALFPQLAASQRAAKSSIDVSPVVSPGQQLPLAVQSADSLSFSYGASFKETDRRDTYSTFQVTPTGSCSHC
jgi:hypothetical protein